MTTGYDLKLKIDIKLPTLNEYINLERRNKFAAATLKKKTEANIQWIIKQQKKKLEGLYDIDLFWQTENNKIDSDNIFFAQKFILDAVVAEKILPNDGRKNIRDIHHHILTTKKSCVTVCFRPACFIDEKWKEVI